VLCLAELAPMLLPGSSRHRYCIQSAAVFFYRPSTSIKHLRHGIVLCCCR
jgi:hypothetical protein